MEGLLRHTDQGRIHGGNENGPSSQIHGGQETWLNGGSEEPGNATPE